MLEKMFCVCLLPALHIALRTEGQTRYSDWALASLTLPSFFSGILLIYLFIPWNSKTICYIQIMQAKATAAVTCDIHIIFRKKEEPPPAIKDLPSLLSTIRPLDPLKIRHFDPSTL